MCKFSSQGKCGITRKPPGIFIDGWYDPCDGTKEEEADCPFWNGNKKLLEDYIRNS